MRSKLPKGYVWEAQHAKKEHKKGRAIGGMVMGIRTEIAEEKRERERER